MTDLKHLLDRAAGDEPAITDDQLASDLHRGQRHRKRRQLTTAVGSVAATALVVTAGWALLPDANRAGPAPQDRFAASPTSKPPASREIIDPRSRPEDKLPPAPKPPRPVELVPDGKVRPGTNLVCDLKPRGWKAVVFSGAGREWSELNYVDPRLHGRGRYHRSTTQLTVRNARFMAGGAVEKYSETWDQLKDRHRRAGDRTAVVSGASMGPDTEANSLRDFHMKMNEKRLIAVHNSASGLGWDMPTALRFVGSCHYAN